MVTGITLGELIRTVAGSLALLRGPYQQLANGPSGIRTQDLRIMSSLRSRDTGLRENATEHRYDTWVQVILSGLLSFNLLLGTVWVQ